MQGKPEEAAAPTTKPATKIEGYADLRKMLDNKDIDAISTATPNHWHSLIVVWGCQAGKDVYVEKPISHNVWEGRQAVAAARKYNRIVQAGTQARANDALGAAYKWIQEGGMGKIKVARGLCYKRRATIGLTEGPQEVPASVDYDLWSGPAAKEAPHRKQFHYDWHWQWAYGNGDLGNQGIHQMDTARWALGKNTLAPSVLSIGGRFGYKDDGETPNSQIVIQDYGDSLLIFEVRGLPKESGSGLMDKYRGQSVGTVVECEGGYLTDQGYTSSPMAYDYSGKLIKKFTMSKEKDDPAMKSDHFGNWIAAVRSRKQEDLNADILEGHLSSALCHTGNISYRLGEKVKSKEIREVLKDNPAALETFSRFRDHLEDNEVSLMSDNAVLGAALTMDVKTEKFTGDNAEKANKFLTREYRKPFVVPESV
ncbi:Gfo/Idh/MocA family oxidoreductase [Humisphaera borealis]|uniref:Gfo/Idh/MocA family oxidoreductase n=2 Tax=Humisphaera borealis TaxID=2807512 RepID=A0A7M2X4B5_9BACT|nr:Gfo/Idh/MocA family oxidoreductase [Humisphaera borealis]